MDRSASQGHVSMDQKFHLHQQKWGDKPASIKNITMMTKRDQTHYLTSLVSSTDYSFWNAHNVCRSRDEHIEGTLSFLMMFHQMVFFLFLAAALFS